MTKHTPAPWKVSGNNARMSIKGNGFTVATIIVTSKAQPEEKQANARLIAAAPELLEALKAILANYDSGEFSVICKETGEPANFDFARATILKAEG